MYGRKECLWLTDSGMLGDEWEKAR